jgi:hypothetical protein
LAVVQPGAVPARSVSAVTLPSQVASWSGGPRPGRPRTVTFDAVA